MMTENQDNTGILNELPVKEVCFALTCSSSCVPYPKSPH